MNLSLNEEYTYLVEDGKEYGKSWWELLKITLLDKISRIVGLLLFGLAVILFSFAIVAGLSVALIYALSLCMPSWAATLIVVAVWVLILLLLIVLRKQIFLNPVIGAIAAILFADKANKKMTIDTVAQDMQMAQYKVAEQEKNLRRDVSRVESRVNSIIEQVNSFGNTFRRVLNFFKRK